MSFSGKYQQVSQENFEPFMKAIGLPDEIIKQIKDLKSSTEIENNGDYFKITVTTGPNVTVNEFTVGKESEVTSLTGEKIKAVIRREGNKLIVPLQTVVSVTELVDPNTLLTTMTLGNIMYKTTNKRV